jgi:hypothetical protein
MKLPRSSNSRNLRGSLEPQPAAYCDRNPSSSLFPQTPKSLRSSMDICRSTGGKQPLAACRDYILQCTLQVFRHIERAMKSYFEWCRLLDQPVHAIAVYTSIGPKHSCNEPAYTKRPGVFEVFLHECKLGL